MGVEGMLNSRKDLLKQFSKPERFLGLLDIANGVAPASAPMARVLALIVAADLLAEFPALRKTKHMNTPSEPIPLEPEDLA